MTTLSDDALRLAAEMRAGLEGVDLSLAKSWRERQAHFANARPPENFCCDDGPYPGWHAARHSPKERPDD